MAIYSKRAKIVNKSVGIRKNPLGSAYVSEEVAFELKKNDIVVIMDPNIYYSWDDKPFYSCEDEYGKKGFVRTEVIEFL